MQNWKEPEGQFILCMMYKVLCEINVNTDV